MDGSNLFASLLTAANDSYSEQLATPFASAQYGVGQAFPGNQTRVLSVEELFKLEQCLKLLENQLKDHLQRLGSSDSPQNREAPALSADPHALRHTVSAPHAPRPYYSPASNQISPQPSTENSYQLGKRSSLKSARSGVCQIPKCPNQLTSSDYSTGHPRFQMCRMHKEALDIPVNGHFYRFCQQCGRLQGREEFDGLKRSCRASLERHNARRRAMRAARRAGKSLDVANSTDGDELAFAAAAAIAVVAAENQRRIAGVATHEARLAELLHVAQEVEEET